MNCPYYYDKVSPRRSGNDYKNLREREDFIPLNGTDNEMRLLEFEDPRSTLPTEKPIEEVQLFSRKRYLRSADSSISDKSDKTQSNDNIEVITPKGYLRIGNVPSKIDNATLVVGPLPTKYLRFVTLKNANPFSVEENSDKATDVVKARYLRSESLPFKIENTTAISPIKKKNLRFISDLNVDQNENIDKNDSILKEKILNEKSSDDETDMKAEELRIISSIQSSIDNIKISLPSSTNNLRFVTRSLISGNTSITNLDSSSSASSKNYFSDEYVYATIILVAILLAILIKLVVQMMITFLINKDNNDDDLSISVTKDMRASKYDVCSPEIQIGENSKPLNGIRLRSRTPTSDTKRKSGSTNTFLLFSPSADE